jgi:hypothetical protein
MTSHFNVVVAIHIFSLNISSEPFLSSWQVSLPLFNNVFRADLKFCFPIAAFPVLYICLYYYRFSDTVNTLNLSAIISTVSIIAVFVTVTECNRCAGIFVTYRPTKIQVLKFKVCKSVHHRTIQINHQTDATIFSVYYPDVYLQLNTFREFSRSSSGAQWLQ